jgi:hypothetical protein
MIGYGLIEGRHNWISSVELLPEAWLKPGEDCEQVFTVTLKRLIFGLSQPEICTIVQITSHTSSKAQA